MEYYIATEKLTETAIDRKAGAIEGDAILAGKMDEASMLEACRYNSNAEAFEASVEATTLSCGVATDNVMPAIAIVTNVLVAASEGDVGEAIETCGIEGGKQTDILQIGQ